MFFTKKYIVKLVSAFNFYQMKMLPNSSKHLKLSMFYIKPENGNNDFETYITLARK